MEIQPEKFEPIRRLHAELARLGLPVVSVSRERVDLAETATARQRQEAEQLRVEWDWRERRLKPRDAVAVDVNFWLRDGDAAVQLARLQKTVALLVAEVKRLSPNFGENDGLPPGDEVDDTPDSREGLQREESDSER